MFRGRMPERRLHLPQNLPLRNHLPWQCLPWRKDCRARSSAPARRLHCLRQRRYICPRPFPRRSFRCQRLLSPPPPLSLPPRIPSFPSRQGLRSLPLPPLPRLRFFLPLQQLHLVPFLPRQLPPHSPPGLPAVPARKRMPSRIRRGSEPRPSVPPHVSSYFLFSLSFSSRGVNVRKNIFNNSAVRV